jgi:hypothetical protein
VSGTLAESGAAPDGDGLQHEASTSPGSGNAPDDTRRSRRPERRASVIAFLLMGCQAVLSGALLFAACAKARQPDVLASGVARRSSARRGHPSADTVASGVGGWVGAGGADESACASAVDDGDRHWNAAARYCVGHVGMRSAVVASVRLPRRRKTREVERRADVQRRTCAAERCWDDAELLDARCVAGVACVGDGVGCHRRRSADSARDARANGNARDFRLSTGATRNGAGRAPAHTGTTTTPAVLRSGRRRDPGVSTLPQRACVERWRVKCRGTAHACAHDGSDRYAEWLYLTTPTRGRRFRQ